METSAYLDFTAEARRRPRPSQLHADAVIDDENDLLGLRAKRADVEDLDAETADMQYLDDTSNPRPLLTEGVSYKPYLRIEADDLFSTVHRTGAAETIDARTGDQYARLQVFLENHQRDYKTLCRPFPIAPPTQSGRDQIPSERISESKTALARQRALRESRNMLEPQNDDRQPTTLELVGLGTNGDEDIRDALVVIDAAMPESPAEYARQLIARKLPAVVENDDSSAVVDTRKRFKVPQDQYDAVILAVEPLQRLWEWAGEEGRRNDFQSTHGLMKLLAEAPTHFVRRVFFSRTRGLWENVLHDGGSHAGV